MLRKYAGMAVTVVFVVVILALVAGQVLGQPMLFSYVTSGSMSPTIQEGDGFVVFPDQFAGSIGEGDVIVFHAEEIQGGGLTTHRVVGQTDEGYITQGDANPFTDQDGGEPVVTDDKIVGVALQIGDRVVTIPSLGTAIIGIQSLGVTLYTGVANALGFEGTTDPQEVGTVLFGTGLVLLAVNFLYSLLGRSGTKRERSRSQEREGWVDPRYVALFLVVAFVLPANVAMVGPTTTHEMTVDGTELAGTVQPGEAVDIDMTATNDGFVTMFVVFDEPQEATLSQQHVEVTGGSSVSLSLSTPAPPPDEHRTVAVSEHRYILVLPSSLLAALHDVHPLVALGAVNAVLAGSALALVVGLFGFRRQRVRETSREVPLRIRTKRLLRRLVLPLDGRR